MYKIKFSKTAEKQLYNLDASVQKRMIKVLERIIIRPFHFVKRKEGTSYFILRVGDYKAILNIKIDKALILVIDVGHRKKIYK